jgi:hypothetical protein
VKWFLVWMLGGTTLVIAVACLLLLMARSRMRRHHRVDRKVATGAPLTWLVDPRSPARLHRRLARVGTVATSVAEEQQQPRRGLSRTLGRKPEPTPIAAVAADLTAQAVATDRQLARIATLAPSARRGPLLELEHRVAGLERAAGQLAALNAASFTPRALAHDHPEIVDVQGQLTRLADAQRELDALDAQAGLVPAASSPFGAPATPPPPPAPPARAFRATVAAPPPPTTATSRGSSA